MTTTKFLYSIKTRDGRKFEVEAESAEAALQAAGVAQYECRAFYPFPTRRVPTEEEKIERAARFAMLREKYGHRRPRVRVLGRNKIEV